MSEIIFIRGEFHKKDYPELMITEYVGDKILLGNNPRIVCQTSDLDLTDYLRRHFCRGVSTYYNANLNMVRVSSAEKLFSEKEICREEEYCWSGKLHVQHGILYIGDKSLYHIIWKESPLRTTDHGFLYIEINLENISPYTRTYNNVIGD